MLHLPSLEHLRNRGYKPLLERKFPEQSIIKARTADDGVRCYYQFTPHSYLKEQDAVAMSALTFVNDRKNPTIAEKEGRMEVEVGQQHSSNVVGLAVGDILSSEDPIKIVVSLIMSPKWRKWTPIVGSVPYDDKLLQLFPEPTGDKKKDKEARMSAANELGNVVELQWLPTTTTTTTTTTTSSDNRLFPINLEKMCYYGNINMIAKEEGDRRKNAGEPDVEDEKSAIVMLQKLINSMLMLENVQAKFRELTVMKDQDGEDANVAAEITVDLTRLPAEHVVIDADDDDGDADSATVEEIGEEAAQEGEEEEDSLERAEADEQEDPRVDQFFDNADKKKGPKKKEARGGGNRSTKELETKMTNVMPSTKHRKRRTPVFYGSGEDQNGAKPSATTKANKGKQQQTNNNDLVENEKAKKAKSNASSNVTTTKKANKSTEAATTKKTATGVTTSRRNGNQKKVLEEEEERNRRDNSSEEVAALRAEIKEMNRKQEESMKKLLINKRPEEPPVATPTMNHRPPSQQHFRSSSLINQQQQPASQHNRDRGRKVQTRNFDNDHPSSWDNYDEDADTADEYDGFQNNRHNRRTLPANRPPKQEHYNNETTDDDGGVVTKKDLLAFAEVLLKQQSTQQQSLQPSQSTQQSSSMEQSTKQDQNSGLVATMSNVMLSQTNQIQLLTEALAIARSSPQQQNQLLAFNNNPTLQQTTSLAQQLMAASTALTTAAPEQPVNNPTLQFISTLTPLQRAHFLTVLQQQQQPNQPTQLLSQAPSPQQNPFNQLLSSLSPWQQQQFQASPVFNAYSSPHHQQANPPISNEQMIAALLSKQYQGGGGTTSTASIFSRQHFNH